MKHALADSPLIHFRNFSFKYDAQQSPSLYNIDLEIRKGEKILIAGPSGCGKSTLIHCMNGLIPFSYHGESSGSLTVAGKEVSEQSIFELSKIIGTVLQDSDGQFIGLTVAEDIAFALENDCIPGSRLHEEVRRAAETVNIASHLLHAPSELSGGQKQKVAVAGILVDNVDVLLFDEPLANLDPAAGKKTIELIDDIREETGAAVIIVEHRIEDVLWRSVDRLVLMNDGKIVADGSPDEILSTNLLAEAGVREPLYVTALKYAGVNIIPEMKPRSISEIVLNRENIEKVQRWYRHAVSPCRKKDAGTLLSVEGLQFTYSRGKQAIRGISTELKEGEMVAIAGTNGAGKSTFSKLLCGFEKPQSGIIRLHGRDIDNLSIKERADHIGYVMQNPNQMISKVMIADEISLGLRTREIPEDEIHRRVEKTMKVCGLWSFRNWPISALSYGQKKRVTIASILVLDPELIILDEPSAGQDYRHYTEIMDFLKEINQKGVTVVMITHDMHLMLEYANRALIFSEGKIISDSTCAAVLTNNDVIEKSSLKRTSLYDLAVKCGIDDAESFVQHFIDYERRVVRT